MDCNLSAIGHCPILYQITVSVQSIVLMLHNVFPSYIGMYTDTASHISLKTSQWNYYASEIKYDVFPERFTLRPSKPVHVTYPKFESYRIIFSNYLTKAVLISGALLSKLLYIYKGFSKHHPNFVSCVCKIPCTVLVCPSRSLSTFYPFIPFLTIRKHYKHGVLSFFFIHFSVYNIIRLCYHYSIIISLLHLFNLFCNSAIHITPSTLQLTVHWLHQQHTDQSGSLWQILRGPF